jgi:hypothetical protein
MHQTFYKDWSIIDNPFMTIAELSTPDFHYVIDGRKEREVFIIGGETHYFQCMIDAVTEGRVTDFLKLVSQIEDKYCGFRYRVKIGYRSLSNFPEPKAGL